MPTDLGLGTSLVDNPVAADGETGEEELVLLLPPQLQRIGALLSTPEGKPTALCKGVYAVLAVPGLWLFVPGYGAWGSSTRDKLAMPVRCSSRRSLQGRSMNTHRCRSERRSSRWRPHRSNAG
eukprot:COSAG06_NODE_2215_length_7325_cov_5.038887_10_plen_123_part_00